MRRTSFGLVLAVGFAAMSCASWVPGREPAIERGEVELEVFSGFAAPQSATGVPPKRIVVLIDATSSMLRRTSRGETLFDAARSGAANLLNGLSDDDEIALYAVGQRRSGGCAVPERLAGPDRGAARAQTLAALGQVRPEAEGSLAASIHEIRTELDAEGATRRTRVVVFSALDAECGGDLCQEAEALVEAGGWIDLRVIGDAQPPACINGLRPSAATPGWTATYLSPPPPTFRVVEPEGDAHFVLGSGQAGAGAVTVRAGLVTLEVDLSPTEQIGPFRLRPDEHVRVRLLDFPGAVPRDRAWQVERSGEDFERRAPGEPVPASGRPSEMSWR